MTHNDAAADAVSGPGGTPPGPSAVRPGSTDPADPAFSDGMSGAADRPMEASGTPTDSPFSGAPAGPAEQPYPGTPAGSADPAFMPPSAEPPAPVSVPGDQEEFAEPPVPADVTLPPELAEAARTLFGDRLDLAAAYAELLATEGVVRGLIGPREAPRIWERHLLNCAAVAERIPEGATVLDVGSGAGLPGLVLAIARPDLTVTLIEPLARRTSFLIEAVQQLGLTKMVRVFRGRAEEAAAGSRDTPPLRGDIVTARAVAPLDRLAAWCLPLVVPGGRLVALKGASAAEEIAEHAGAVARLGGGEPEVHRCGVGVIEPPATVIEVVRERVVGPVRKKAAAKRSRGGRRAGRGRDR
ncbi:16S rRNA (guanine(527)-N(7))-methyltransferase RsmG [Micromonospora globispora]|uniref:Ribosomal RNA small subunit methyltransferase G n=2 Tax=Micromonospora globispora TaxID=1450148 RepID=A0A317JYR5_9ACTN|nr:16S rRNA (guanine(527)-N(7))-methyltransferase RsmG [Micromonospora globispora]PWU59808.1 16S rRNA (guanine(527)-N(7))-methyltransferase RsmG [Micromonospora globispora]RQW98797.1 16S rRNA (guanine(527)-N(7))-methyltransferase RsmG [Micromonospora globispora]